MANQPSIDDAVTVTSEANKTITNTTDVEGTSFVQSETWSVWHVLLAAVFIVLILVVAMIVRWIYRIRKYNRLRHYLIPTYTFDPNEEETWDTSVDNQESAIFAGSSLQGYQSMGAKNNVGEVQSSSSRGNNP